MPAITFIKSPEDGRYNVRLGDTFCGSLEVDMDGYFYFYPVKKDGYMPSWFLRGIADKLDELNREWDEELVRYLEEHPGDPVFDSY